MIEKITTTDSTGLGRNESQPEMSTACTGMFESNSASFYVQARQQSALKCVCSVVRLGSELSVGRAHERDAIRL